MKSSPHDCIEFAEFAFQYLDPYENLSGDGRVASDQDYLNENLFNVEVLIEIVYLLVNLYKIKEVLSCESGEWYFRKVLCEKFLIRRPKANEMCLYPYVPPDSSSSLTKVAFHDSFLYCGFFGIMCVL